MKAIFIITLLLSQTLFGIAQAKFTFNDDMVYAVIKDSDSYINVRSAPNNHSPILGKIYKYHVFSCESDKTNWWKALHIEYDANHKSSWLEGYIHKSRVTLLSTWVTIKRENIFADSCVFKNNGLSIVVKKTAFQPKKHKVVKKSQDLLFIDGKGFWGTDGEIPKESISKLTIKKNGKSIIIPGNAFDDLYEPHFKTLSICNGPENTWFIKMTNSDGAGGYDIIWIFKDDKYLMRYVDDSMV